MPPKLKTRTCVDRMKHLLRRRTNILGSASLIKSFNDEYDETMVHQVQVRIDLLDELWKKFAEIEDEIETHEDSDSTDLSEQRVSFQNMYVDLKSSLITKLPRGDAPPTSRVSVAPGQPPISQAVRLPEIKIPEFDGNPEDWIEFRDLFKSLVHANPQLTSVQKLHYLKAAVKGEAHHIISSLPVSTENYAIAWKAIEKRYDNPNLLIKRHIAALFSIPALKRESASGLSTLLDQFDRHVSVLNQLEGPDRHWNSVLVESLSRRLDSVTLKEWEKQGKENERPTYEQLVNFIRKQARMLQSVNLSQNACVTNNDQKKLPSKPSSTFLASEPSVKCPQCKQGHLLYQCVQFKKLAPKERFNLAKRYKLCINCLGGYHMAKNCNSSNCSVCGNRHHTLLHLPNTNDLAPSNHNVSHSFMVNELSVPNEDYLLSPQANQYNTQSPPSISNPTHTSVAHSFAALSSSTTVSCVPSTAPTKKTLIECNSTQMCPPRNNGSEVFLATALVRVKDSYNRSQFARIVLDSCSQANFVSEPLANKLGIKRSKTNIEVIGVSSSKLRITESVVLNINSRVGKFACAVSCLVIPKIPAILPSKNIDISDWNIPSTVVLADPKFNISAGVDMLIGAELFFSLLESKRISFAKGCPLLQCTVFGYVMSGMYSSSANQPPICIVSTANSLDGMLQRFWELDNLDTGRALTLDEQRCEDHFRRTISRESDGRYVVRLPLREDRLPFLGDSYQLAQRRLLSTERRFRIHPNLHDNYHQFMDEYARLGHMEPSVYAGNRQSFLPHHPIFRPDSTTTKIRIVFDGSCSESNQLSLNEVLYAGPTVQPTLLSIVLNFRLPKFVFIADIEKMFRQIWVHPEDRKFLQILWRNNPYDPISKFQLTTVTYGTSCAPYQAARVLMQLADDEETRFPMGAKIIRKDTYVDDTLTGGYELDEVIESTVQLRSLLAAGGFNLRKWCANDKRVLSKIPQDLIEMPNEIEMDRSSSVKTLGLLWNPHSDQFAFKIPSLPNTDTLTKRVVVSEMAQLFDPMGLVGSVVAAAKIFVQRLWVGEYTWDEPLPEEVREWWQAYRDELPTLQQLKVPRRVIDSRPYSIHCFCDASERGYGCCVYIVSTDGISDQSSNLLITKSRVAPVSAQSIPRLELCAALLGSQLIHQILTTTDFVGPVTLWSDSSVVLHWIHSPPSIWKVFVSNRIAEIQKLSEGHSWRHVPSELNPADDISRGVQPNQLVNNKLWWHGPDFLLKHRDSWPLNQPTTNNEEALVERRPLVSLFTTNTNQLEWDIFDRFSELSTLLKVVARCLRFFNNVSKPQSRKFGSLTPEELNLALKYLIRVAQQQSFPNEIKLLLKANAEDCSQPEMNFKSLMKGLNLYLDEFGLLRIKGRLEKLSAPLDTRCPILLPSNHRITLLIARSIHLQTLHAGPTLLLSTIRQRFWPLHGRTLARKIVRECIQCFRCNPRCNQQIMAPLPSVRITPARTFSNSGLDYCGPFLVRPLVGRGSPVKIYVANFVCMASKAMHLEIVYDLSSQACINAIKRFIARRGRLLNLYCDNATTFVGANRELKELRAQYLKQFKTECWNNFCLEQGINFHFIPARSPHFGGLWEAGVKSFKYHFRRILGAKSLRLDDMVTAVTQIEGILNSRPLTPLSSNAKDLNALTPGHFIIGEPMFSIPEPDVTDLNTNRLNRFQELKRSVQDFWHRWSRDYVSQLHQRTKWQTKTQIDPVKGALVLLKQENLPPLQWNLGRVVETFPGSDGHNRVVQVRTARGLFKRAVTEVCTLPIDVTPTPSPAVNQAQNENRIQRTSAGASSPVQQKPMMTRNRAKRC